MVESKYLKVEKFSCCSWWIIDNEHLWEVNATLELASDIWWVGSVCTMTQASRTHFLIFSEKKHWGTYNGRSTTPNSKLLGIGSFIPPFSLKRKALRGQRRGTTPPPPSQHTHFHHHPVPNGIIFRPQLWFKRSAPHQYCVVPSVILYFMKFGQFWNIIIISPTLRMQHRHFLKHKYSMWEMWLYL